MHRFQGLVIVLASVAWTAGALAATDPTPTQLPRLVRPTHYDVTIEPDAAALTFHGDVAISLEVLAPVDEHHAQCRGPAVRVGALHGCGGRARYGAAKITVDEATQTRRFPSSEDSIRPVPARARLHRQDRHPGDRPVRPRLRHRRGRKSARCSPSSRAPTRAACCRRGTSRPTRRPSTSRRSCRRRRWRSATCRWRSGPTRRRPRARPLRASPKMSTYLLFFGARRLRARDRAGRPRPRSASSRSKGAVGPGAVRARSIGARCCASTTTTSACPIRCPSSTTSRRPAAASSSARWRTGARSSPSSTRCCSIPTISTADRPPARLQHRRARDRAPVVRQPGHHALVGRPVAQRRLRVVDGEAHQRSACTRSGTRCSGAVRRPRGGDGARLRSPPRTRSCSTIETVEQASQAFDAITYSKGEAVIRMLEDYVGDDAWRDGVRRYIARARLRQHRHRRPVARRSRRPPASRSRRSRTTSRCSPACR